MVARGAVPPPPKSKILPQVRGWGYLTKFEFRQTLTAFQLLLVPLSVKTPLGRSTSRYFDRRQAYFDFRIQLKIKILTTLKIVRKFLTKIFLNIFWDEKSKYCINLSLKISFQALIIFCHNFNKTSRKNLTNKWENIGGKLVRYLIFLSHKMSENFLSKIF